MEMDSKRMVHNISQRERYDIIDEWKKEQMERERYILDPTPEGIEFCASIMVKVGRDTIKRLVIDKDEKAFNTVISAIEEKMPSFKELSQFDRKMCMSGFYTVFRDLLLI